MKDKILLVRPPTVMKGASFIATQFPINIASIAAVLRKNGFNTRIWDFDVELFDEKTVEERLKDFSPVLAGISCYTPTVVNGHRIAALIKKYSPDVCTIVGGPHVSAMPEATLGEFRAFDMGVVGEGEETMLELAIRIRDGKCIDDTQGIVFRKGNSIIKTAKRAIISDLDMLPFPARDLLNTELYKGQSHRGFSRSFLRITEIMTSRGCPNHCIFCASDVVMGSGVRFRSAGSVREEIAECVEKYGFNHFAISDDTFTLREDRLREICEEFARRKLTWNCNARVWPMSREVLDMMVKSGCAGITFGVESGSPRMLKLIKKNVTVEQIEAAFALSKEVGIKLVEADIIIGSHPSETEEDIELTKRLIRRISPDIIMASIVVPYPGTELYEIMKRMDLISQDRKWDSFVLFGKEPFWRTEHFDSRKLVALQKKILLSFYFRPAYIARTLGKIRSVKELMYWLRGGMEFLIRCFQKNV